MESLLIQPEKKWFSHILKNEPSKNTKPDQKPALIENSDLLRSEAKKLLDQDIINYNKWRETAKRSETNWIRTVMAKGTLSDKISAGCILVQESAVHNLDTLQSLISSVKLIKKRECMLAMDALKQLFVEYLLPPDRQLATFQQHPFSFLETLKEKRVRDKCLLVWYFESALKEQYASFIRALQAALLDNLATTKFKVCSILCELIKSNPFEQTRYILDVVINKLGDPDHQVASRVLFHLNNFLIKCPRFKMEVLNEIERLVTRSNINSKAHMNQFILSKQDQAVANKLLVVYFSFFKKFVRSKEIDSRMLSALLTGVNRAYKFAKMENDEMDANLNTVFKLVHITSFNVSLQALMLLNQVSATREDVQNRYFSALYRRMLELTSKTTAKETFFLNLLYNSLIKDESIVRLKAFVKRIMQISFSQGAPFVCGAFILISEFLKVKNNLIQLDHSSLLDNKVMNVQSKNGSVERSKALDDDDDEEEHFEDIVGSSEEEECDDDGEKKKKALWKKNEKKKETTSSWQHKKNIVFKRHEHYDYLERNPMYSGADKTLTYELIPLSRHYHPTVVVFANKLLNNEPVDYTGDPMEDFTLIHFLDRFVYKNPKKVKEDTTSKKSVFEPVMSIHKSKVRNLPINSKEYINLNENQIPEEEKFFYNYYKAQASKKALVDDDMASDAGSISDSEFDAYLNRNEQDGIDGNDDDLDDLDFAEAVKGSKSKKKKASESSEEDSEDEELDSLGDEFDDDEDFEEAMNEDDEDDDENFEDVIEEMPSKKSKKRGEKDLSHLFAAADEFSEMINDSSKYDELGVGGLSNADNATPKQLRWELDQDDFGKNGKRWKKGKKSGKLQKNVKITKKHGSPSSSSSKEKSRHNKKFKTSKPKRK